MSVTVEQVLVCDICGVEVNRLKQTVPHSGVAAVIQAPAANINGRTDICAACYGPLLTAFWDVKKGKA